MGTTLTGLTPATTYDALIKVGDNGPLSATAKYVGDGLGNDSVVALSTSSVGIGTTSPTQLLHVAGNVRITGALYDGNNAAGTSGQILSSTGTGTDWVSKSDLSLVDGSGTANYVSKWSDTDTLTNSLIFDNGTNVGIGTSSPTNQGAGVTSLDVAGSAGASLTTRGATVTGEFLALDAAGGLYISTKTSHPMILRTADVERIRITSAGNVGIGTTSPASKMHLVGGGVSTSISDVATTLSSRLDIANPAISLGIGYVASDIPMLQTFNNTNNTASNLTINPFGGNVGIGTSSPSQKLQVAGTGVTRITVENTDNQSTGAGLQMLVKNGGSTVGDGTIRTDNADNMQFFNIAGKIMELTSTGNLSLTTGNIALSAAGGIFFDSGASKYLDDYEIGTWTGTLKGGVSDPTTPVTATGKYTKIGRIVTAEIQLDGKDTTGASGSVTVTGLPFTSSVEAQGAVMCDLYTFGTLCTSANCFVSPFGTTLTFFTSGSGVAWAPLTHSAGAGRSLRATLTYFV